MTIHGIRYVDYRFPAKHWMLAKYYVCDAQDPVISISELVANNYSIAFDKAPQLRFSGKLVCSLVTVRGLTYLEPLGHR